MGKFQTGPTYVELNTITGKEYMTDNKYVEDACHGENKRKLSKTSNTPLVHGQIAQEIGLYSTSDSCLKILQGYYNAPPDTDDYTNAYLKHLKIAPNIIEPPQPTVPTKIFHEGWSKMKECTSAGISGLHFGHLKTCSQSPFLSYF